MSHPCEEIATAIVDYVDTLPLSFNCFPEKPDDAQSELNREHADLKLLVVPFGYFEEKISRGNVRGEYSVNLAVFRKLDSEFTREVLSAFMSELAGHLRFQRMAGFLWTRTEEIVHFDAEHIHQLKQFASLLRVTYAAAT